MRRYDTVLSACYYNPVSQHMVLSFASPAFLSVVDLSQESQLFWRLPDLVGQGRPLVFASDMDRLLVGYDTNHIAVFDLVNKQIDHWTQTNLQKLPHNFLNRYNKFAGVIQVS